MRQFCQQCGSRRTPLYCCPTSTPPLSQPPLCTRSARDAVAISLQDNKPRRRLAAEPRHPLLGNAPSLRLMRANTMGGPVAPRESGGACRRERSHAWRQLGGSPRRWPRDHVCPLSGSVWRPPRACGAPPFTRTRRPHPPRPAPQRATRAACWACWGWVPPTTACHSGWSPRPSWPASAPSCRGEEPGGSAGGLQHAANRARCARGAPE